MNARRLGAVALLAAALVTASALPAAAVTPEPPLAASSNVHVLDHIPGTAAGMNFKDHYAFVSGWTGVMVLDIANPAAPKIAGGLALPHFENEDVELCGNTLIVVNDREAKDIGSGMYVIGISPPPSPPRSAHLPPADIAQRQRHPAAGTDRQRPRLGPHRQLRQERLHAGVDRRWRPRRG